MIALFNDMDQIDKLSYFGKFADAAYKFSSINSLKSYLSKKIKFHKVKSEKELKMDVNEQYKEIDCDCQYYLYYNYLYLVLVLREYKILKKLRDSLMKQSIFGKMFAQKGIKMRVK